MRPAGGDGVGPEALQWPVGRSLLLGFGRLCRAGVQHGLQDPPPCVYEPGKVAESGLNVLLSSAGGGGRRSPVVDLQQRQVRLRGDLLLLILSGVRMLGGGGFQTVILHSKDAQRVEMTHPDVLEEPGAHDVGGVFG